MANAKDGHDAHTQEQDAAGVAKTQSGSQTPVGHERDQPAAPVVSRTAPPPPPPPGPAADPPAPAPQRSTSWVPWVILGVVVVVAVGVILALTVFKSSDGGASKQTAYQSQVSAIMAPVLAANRDLSSALSALHGGKTPSKATNAVHRDHVAKQATLTAQGGLNVLAVPAGSDQVASNARGTLIRELAYLDGVDTALNQPSATNAATAQTQGSNLTDALNTISPPGTNWAGSVNGPSQLTIWEAAVHSAKARKTAKAKAKARARTRRRHHSAPAPAAPVSGTDCGGDVHAGPNTSCAFALNVRDAYNEAPGRVTSVDVFSPTTGRTYTMFCSPAGSGITCTGGNNASVTFP
jgi:hypothetical protein